MGADPCEHTDTVRQLRRRRAASWRSPVLECGRADPWHYPPPCNGYEDAAEHLLRLGYVPAPNLHAMRRMWRQGGTARRLAMEIAERWYAAE